MEKKKKTSNLPVSLCTRHKETFFPPWRLIQKCIIPLFLFIKPAYNFRLKNKHCLIKWIDNYNFYGKLMWCEIDDSGIIRTLNPIQDILKQDLI